MCIVIQRTNQKWNANTIVIWITVLADDGTILFGAPGVECTDYPQVPAGTYEAVCQQMYTKKIDGIWFGAKLAAPFHNYFLHNGGLGDVEGCHGIRYYLWPRLADAIGYKIGKVIEYRVIDAPLS